MAAAGQTSTQEITSLTSSPKYLRGNLCHTLELNLQTLVQLTLQQYANAISKPPESSGHIIAC